MAEVTLKKKITLRRKEEQAAFTFSGKLKVNAARKSKVDDNTAKMQSIKQLGV